MDHDLVHIFFELFIVLDVKIVLMDQFFGDNVPDKHLFIRRLVKKAVNVIFLHREL